MYRKSNYRRLCFGSGRDASKCGMTLIEVMIAMVVFGIAASSLFAMLNHGFRTIENARDVVRVTQTMQHQMENLRATPWTDFLLQVGNSQINVDVNGVPTGSDVEVIPFGWREFSMVQTITLEKTDYYEVEITAAWTDTSGREFSHSFVSWFTENGLNEFFTRSTT